MKLIVGLGNPGSKYQRTRHNAGFLIIDQLCEELKLTWTESKFDGLTAKGSFEGQPVIFLKPMTFMNLSGQCVSKLLNFFKIPVADLIVLYDDVDVPPGKVKIRMDGGHGGHNGMRSIIELTGSNSFPRIKLGVGKAPPEIPMDTADWVLAPFSQTELDILHGEMYKEVLARLKTLVLA